MAGALKKRKAMERTTNENFIVIDVFIFKNGGTNGQFILNPKSPKHLMWQKKPKLSGIIVTTITH